MLSQISLVLLALLSHLDPSAVDLIELAERVGITGTVEQRSGDALAAVQVDLLPDREGAEALAATMERRLEQRGSELEVFVETVGGEAELPPSYRVGVGPFDSFEAAERARAELDALGLDGFVRELDDILGC